ncbi:unnamed protein product, partial [Ectocarpus fasciculatus]
MRPFLCNQTIPLPLRVVALKGIMIPTLLFGAEFAPMLRRAGDPLQELLNRILRTMIRVKESDTNIPVAPLYREFNIPPMRVSMYCERVRVFRRCEQVRTWASAVLTRSTGVVGRTWGSSTRDWLRNRFHRAANAVREREQPRVRIGEWEQMPSDALVDQSLGRVETMRGLPLIVKARMNAIYTADTVSRLGLIPNEFRSSCPFCLEKEPESLKHLVADCQKWVSIR